MRFESIQDLSMHDTSLRTGTAVTPKLALSPLTAKLSGGMKPLQTLREEHQREQKPLLDTDEEDEDSPVKTRPKQPDFNCSVQNLNDSKTSLSGGNVECNAAEILIKFMKSDLTEEDDDDKDLLNFT
ncbi:uncharacterized protein LOC128546410 [Mercenaria mercenaria]|uniref:uncharacterized protein LOC128546410 n=1 Tax=Mercenaria mercenaria TaxID=6596 RepID=UPI00234F0A0C|nr:uncharacterized protein LOC128546410 [Mercenaria mercenaria]